MPIIACRLIEVCVFRFLQDRAEYLVLKRSKTDNLYPGIWQIITGMLHEGERAVDGALREMKEETGLSPLRLWTASHASTFYDYTTDTLNVCPLFAAQVCHMHEPTLSSEHERYAWMPYEQARWHLVWPSQRDGLEVMEKYIVGGEPAGVLTTIPLPCES